MAYPLSAPVLAVLLSVVASSPLRAQDPPPPSAPAPEPERLDMSLSPECRVPGSRLYTLAPLKSVKAALKERRAVKVLAIGSASTVGFGAMSPLASYPARLEGELKRLFHDTDVEVVNRGISGEIAGDAMERIKAAVAEVEPDLVVWQVGTNDALARVEIETISEALDETIQWLKSHAIDVVLVDPQYTASMGKDEHYGRVVDAIKDVARKDGVPLVLRYEAMRYLAGRGGSRSSPGLGGFQLNDLGHRCMAEHVARAITMGLLQEEAPADGSAAAQIR